MFLGRRMSDGSLSERRTSLGTTPWIEAMETFLANTTAGDDAPEASYKGLRLVGVDGTTFNVGNTPTMKDTATKTKTRRGEAAFYRISCVALAALGSHRPLAVRIGEAGESEGALAARIIGQVGENDLLIADRYYGSGKWVARLDALPSKPWFLLLFRSVSARYRSSGLPMTRSMSLLRTRTAKRPSWFGRSKPR
jgi:hypothetical protein